ncbi:MAG: hypothetical protein Q7V88_12970 [Actinomycetota bacterium]|nr:hypothetical protein [Actinomycetota bacterium]
MNRSTTLLLGALAATSLLAACSDDATPAATPTTSAAGDTTDDVASDTTDDAASDTTEAGSDTTEAGSNTTEGGSETTEGGSNDPSVEAFCDMVRDYLDVGDSLDSVFDADTPDPVAIEDAFRTMSDMTDELADAAPAEVKADAETVAEGFHQIIDVMASYDWDLVAIASSDEFFALTSDEEISAASDRLDQWSADTCGIPLDS